VELLATSTWIWVAGVRVERYARGSSLETIGQDGLAITDGDAALRRWVTLVPDQDDVLPWAVSQLAAPPVDSSSGVEGASEAPIAAARPLLDVVPAPPPGADESPTIVVPSVEPATSDQPSTEPPPRAGPRWDDPRSVIDDGRR